MSYRVIRGGATERFLRAQIELYGTHELSSQPPARSNYQEAQAPQTSVESTPTKPNLLKRPAFRYSAIGVAAVTAAVLILPSQFAERSENTVPAADSGQVIVAEEQPNQAEAPTNPEESPIADQPTPDNHEQQPLPELGSITFASIFGGDHAQLGAIHMSTVGGEGKVNIIQKDKPKNVASLPGMVHEQNVEVYAQPARNKKGEVVNPITVTTEEDGYRIRFDRSQIAVIVSPIMLGAYSATIDDKNKTPTVVSLNSDDKQDKFQLTYLPPDTKLDIESDKKVSDMDKNLAIALTDGKSTNLAIAGAKVMAVKQSLNYLTSLAADKCFAAPTDNDPTAITPLIKKRIDDQFISAIDQLARDKQVRVYIEMAGQYPLDVASIEAQVESLKAYDNSKPFQEAIKDIDAAKKHKTARLFGVASTKTICTPDQQLRPSK